MPKVVLVIAFFSLFACTGISKTELQKKYPINMLSSDHGVLNKKDVQFYFEEFDPPVGNEVTNHASWICVERKNIKFVCNDFGPTDVEPIEHFGESEVHLSLDNQQYIYSWAQGIEIDGCKELVKQWTKLSRDVLHVCVGGYRINDQKLSNGKVIRYFKFDQIRTKRGCYSRIDGRCENLDSEQYLKLEQKKDK